MSDSALTYFADTEADLWSFDAFEKKVGIGKKYLWLECLSSIENSLPSGLQQAKAAWTLNCHAYESTSHLHNCLQVFISEGREVRRQEARRTRHVQM
jgi:hypothetical protein